MPVGGSGRIVIEIDPELKKELYEIKNVANIITLVFSKTIKHN